MNLPSGLQPFFNFISTYAALLLAVLAVAEGFICFFLLRRIEALRMKVEDAATAAEDAARAAALAAPGGIDPEVVINLLRSGRPASLDAVYTMMQRQIAEAEARERERDEAAAAVSAASESPAQPAAPEPAAPAASETPSGS